MYNNYGIYVHIAMYVRSYQINIDIDQSKLYRYYSN